MIEIEDLSRSFDVPGRAPARALCGVNLTVGTGGVTGVLGPNGAGKTTLFRVLAGLLRPTSGRVRILGHDVATQPLEARGKIGLLTEEPGLPERLTPHGHVAFHVGLRGATRKDASARAGAVLEEMGLGRSSGTPIGRLSKGNRLKVALARAIAHQPEVLLLDEPTANLDIETSIWVRDLIRVRASGGCTVLMATHNPHEAGEVCDDIVVLGRGRVLGHGPPADLRGGGRDGARLDVKLSGGSAPAAARVSRLPWVAVVTPAGERLLIDPAGAGMPESALEEVMAAVSPERVVEFRRITSTIEEAYLSLQKEIPG